MSKNKKNKINELMGLFIVLNYFGILKSVVGLTLRILFGF